MISLRTKIVLSLIGMSLLAVAIGGISARSIVLGRFHDVVEDRAADGFMREAVEYHRTYGSWEQGAAVEPFVVFAARIAPTPRNIPTVPSGAALPRPARPGEGLGLSPTRGTLPGFEGAPPPGFAVMDLQGKVWVPTIGRAMGDILSARELRNSLEIFDGETLIGYAQSSQRVTLSVLEEQYLEALKDAWWFSLLLILAIVVPIGFFQGARLASPIKNLNEAIKAMKPGAIQQNVPVTSSDELGQLSKSFNNMSEDLSIFVQLIKEQQEKIAKTEALRKEGMASISHEIRTPLNTSIAQANAMLDGVRDLDEQQLQILSGSLDHLTKLVDELFQLSLADVNALECQSEVFDFSALIAETINSRKSEFEKRNFNLVTTIPEHMEVDADPTRMRQILDNLLENCCRYTNQNGVIKVELTDQGPFAVLSISDDGPGIAPENLERLFDRFFREDSSRSRASGGSGLGLSLVKTWAEIQGGTAKAFISPDGGLGIQFTASKPL